MTMGTASLPTQTVCDYMGAGRGNRLCAMCQEYNLLSVEKTTYNRNNCKNLSHELLEKIT